MMFHAACGRGLALVAFWAGAGVVMAQLPAARLESLSPRGARVGESVEVRLQGVDLEGVESLLFSHGGLTAVPLEGGRFRIDLASEVPVGVHEVRALGRFGASTGALFAVGVLPEAVDPGGNHGRSTASEVVWPVTVNGVADADASDFFRIRVEKGKVVHLDCAAQRLDSPLHAVLSVRDPSGVEVRRAQRTIDRDPVLSFVPEEDGEYTIEVHDATWRGGEAFAYRLTMAAEAAAAVLPAPLPLAGALAAPLSGEWAGEVEPNDDGAGAQSLGLPAMIEGHLDRDWFTLTAEKSGPLVVEVHSHRLGVPSDPVLVVSRVTRDEAGREQLSLVAEFDDVAGIAGAERFRLGSRDAVGRVEAEAGATYRLLVTDRFHSGGRYRLEVREPRPDFEVVVLPESPVNDAKALMRWPWVLRRQGAVAVAVAVVRRDGFDEPVVIQAEGLPAGVTAADCWVPSGQSAGVMVLRAGPEAGRWSGRLVLTARAGDRVRPVREVTPRWSVGDAAVERVDWRLSADGLWLAVLEDGGVPLQIGAPGAAEVYETSLGATLQVPVTFGREASHKGFKGEWEAGLSGLPGQRLWQPIKPAADAAEATLSLVLTKKDGNQFVPGTWTLYAATRGTVQWQPDEAVPVREVRDAAFSPPLQVVIASSPVKLTAAEEVVVTRAGTVTLPVAVERRFGFGEAVEVGLRVPAALAGLAAAVVPVAKEAAEAVLQIDCGAEVPPGRHPCVLEAKCQWNGEELFSRRDVIIEIKP